MPAISPRKNGPKGAVNMTETSPLLEIQNLKTYFPFSSGFGKGKKGVVHAVDDVSLSIYPKETLGLVGESGCGKSTLARSVMRIENVTAGSIAFMGQDITHLAGTQLRSIRKNMQIIFQDPYSSLDPRMPVGKIVEEPMLVNGVRDPAERRRRAVEMLERVGLREYVYHRYAHEFSGGQRQRISIARALILMPKLILCDEAVSALDVSIQSQILNLLNDLQQELDLTYIFISHAMNVIRHVSKRVGVMYLGKIVELAPTKELFEHPLHPYTKALLSAIPVPDPRQVQNRIVLEGDLPSPKNPPAGCRFHTRCPFCQARCMKEEPVYQEVSPGHFAACHFRDFPPGPSQ